MSYQSERWSLIDLLPPPGTPEQEELLNQIETQLKVFEALRATLSPQITTEAFQDLIRRYEALYTDALRLNMYSYLWFSEDTKNQQALAYKARIGQMVMGIGNRTLFFTLWWKDLDDETANRLIAVSGDTRYYLESLRRFKPHTLSEPEERAINIKDINGMTTVLTLYDLLTSRMLFDLEVDGEKKQLTRGELISYIYSPSAEVRAATYKELYRVYGKEAPVLAEIYAARVRDWTEERVNLRHFPSPISMRNLENDVPDAAVETLLETGRRNVGLFQRYFRLKARHLGLEHFRRSDLYAPLSDSNKIYSFDEAVKIVDEAYRAFSPTLADKAMQVLEKHHLDSETRPGKMGGAYCYGPLPDIIPWVLVNYTGQFRDISTLAHELGHAVHAMMATEHSPLTCMASLPMAETASVFGEMLLNDKLLNEESDPQLRAALLGAILDDSYGTIMRQLYFVLFEKKAHQMINEGATPDQLNEIYLENLREQFGDAVELDDDFKQEWVSIPHIYHTPFYCYAYSFGNLLVLALYRKYKQLGKAFEPHYLRILTYGGSASPAHIISEAGFDITDAAFWQSGFDLLEEMLTELEKLI